MHTGEYANAATQSARRKQLSVLKSAVLYALSNGLEVNVGHGLDYVNIEDITRIEGINEYNIGYSIITHAVFAGLGNAVREMAGLVK